MARLLGYQLVNDAYQSLALNEQGRLWLEPIRLWIGIEDNQIVCYDEAGRALPDYSDLAEARLHELEAELRRLRGEP